jgi:hypothetical protein
MPDLQTPDDLAAIRAYITGTYATSNGPPDKHTHWRPAIELMPPDVLPALLAHIDALTARLATLLPVARRAVAMMAYCPQPDASYLPLTCDIEALWDAVAALDPALRAELEAGE